MTTHVYTVAEDASLRKILDVMLRHDIKHVPVLRGEEPIGMVARHDLLKVIHDRLAE
jgi:CBS domain-containing protein